ncbi:MAG: hypothetical protein ACNA7J_13970, partial [Wenzhouxiangella sp.]
MPSRGVWVTTGAAIVWHGRAPWLGNAGLIGICAGRRDPVTAAILCSFADFSSFEHHDLSRCPVTAASAGTRPRGRPTCDAAPH